MKTKNGQPKKGKQKKESINLDNEIIIGLNTKKLPQTPPKTKKNVKTKKKNKKKSCNLRMIKFLILFILMIVALAFFLLSDLFNCKEIQVLGNSKISQEEIINLSGIKTEENIFKINTKKVKENIKKNAYINNVKLKRKLDGKVEIIVEERKPTFMITCEKRLCIYQ